MPNENDKPTADSAAPSETFLDPAPPQDESIEPYEAPELVKFEQLGKLIVSGE